MTDVAALEHSDLGPSALSRILACPGSFALSRRPEVKALGHRSSVHAARGTVAHRVAEGRLSGEDHARGVTTQEGHDIDVDDELVDAVSVYTDLCEAFISVADWHVVEQRVCLDAYWMPNKPPTSLFGTTDFAGYMAANKLLRVIDYKHGSGVFVSVEDNPQALAYAAGALLICPHDVDEIEITIVQPRVPGKNKIRTARLSKLDLLAWVVGVLIPGVDRVATEPDTYVSGAQCRFCPGTAFCPLLMEAASMEAQKQFAGPDPGAWTPTGFAHALEQADNAEIWIKAVREMAKSMIEEGTEIPGWGLVPTRPTRSWDDPEIAEAIMERLGEDMTRLVETKLRTPAQVEKRVSPTTWDEVREHVKSVSSGLKLTKTGA